MVKLHFIGNVAFRVYANDHRPAHFHIVAPDYQAMVEIETLAVIRGAIPARDRHVMMEWAEVNRDAIRATWNDLNPTLAV